MIRAVGRAKVRGGRESCETSPSPEALTGLRSREMDREALGGLFDTAEDPNYLFTPTSGLAIVRALRALDGETLGEHVEVAAQSAALKVVERLSPLLGETGVAAKQARAVLEELARSGHKMLSRSAEAAALALQRQAAPVAVGAEGGTIMEKNRRIEVAKDILEHLGGPLFVQMTGANRFGATRNGLVFRVPGGRDGINVVEIVANPKGDYRMVFIQAHGATCTTAVTVDDLKEGRLRETFTEQIGLYVAL